MHNVESSYFQQLMCFLRRRFDFIILCIFVLGLYINTLAGDFVWDDKQLIGGFTNLKSALTREFLTRSFYRPLSALSIYYDIQRNGASAEGYHMTNILLNVAAVVLFYILVLKLTSRRWPSILAACAFAALPSHSEAVAWISGRTDLLAAAFMFAALISHIRFRETLLSKWLVVAAAFFLAAMLSKELAVLYPLVVLSYEWLYGHTRKCSFVVWLKPYSVSFVLYLVTRLVALKPWVPSSLPHQAVFEPATGIERLMGIPVNLISYIWMSLIPHYSIPFYSAHTLKALTLVEILLASLLVALCVLIVVKLRKRHPGASFGLMFFALTIIPACNIVQLPGTTMAERFTYIPSAGLVIFVLSLVMVLVDLPLQRIKILQWTALSLIVTYIAISSFFTMKSNLMWRDDFTLWKTAVELRPDVAFIHMNLGDCYLERSLSDMAEQEYKKAIKLGPKLSKAHMCLAEAYRVQGRTDEALHEYQKAIKLDKNNFAAMSNLGTTLAMQEDYDKAEIMFKSALKIMPNYLPARKNLGLLYEQTNRFLAAAREYEAVARVQQLPELVLNAGRCYRLAGHKDEARLLLSPLANQSSDIEISAAAKAELVSMDSQ